MSLSKEHLDSLVFVNFDPLINPFERAWAQQTAAFWTVDVIKSLDKDEMHWKTMSEPLKHTVSTLLHYLLCADYYASAVAGIASEDYAKGNVVIEACFDIHRMIEKVHAQAYALFLKPLYGTNREKWENATNITLSSPGSIMLLEWGRHGAETIRGNPLKLFIHMICYESILFQPFFTIPYALKKSALLPALCAGNELIARDENYHMHNYAYLYLYYTHPDGPHKLPRLDEKYVMSVFTGAINQSHALLTEALPEDIPEHHLVREEIEDYTRLIANGVLKVLEYSARFPVKNSMGPEYIEAKDIPQFTSFHNERPTEYSMPKSDGRSFASIMARRRAT